MSKRPSNRELAGAALAAANAAVARGPKAAKVGGPCGCGCGETTKGGTYATGHDAKHKSALIREAIAGNVDAENTLAERGWTKFLDKAKATAAKRAERAHPEGATRQRTEKVADEVAAARAALARINTLKQARVVLIALGRYGKAAGEQRIELAACAQGGSQTALEIAESILDGSHPQLSREEGVLARKVAAG